MNSDFWEDAQVISVYTRAEALADGTLVDATTGELAEVSRQHYRYPIAMTAAVHHLIDQAVQSPHWGNDWKGVWHDVLWMSRRYYTERNEREREFTAIVTGAGEETQHRFRMVCGPDDAGEPCLTVMLAGED